MKKAIIPFAAMALALASCNTETKDSYQTINFREYNLIIDTQDPSQMAQASDVTYEVKNNISRQVVDVKANDIIINNQKHSFETDTMGLHSTSFKVDGLGDVYNVYFSKYGNAGIGSNVRDLKGTIVYGYAAMSNLLNPVYDIPIVQRLDMSYTLNDRYSVQTFWPAAMFRGQTMSSTTGESHTTKGSDYVAIIDFEKKTASVYVYNAELSANQDKSFPKVIRFGEIPVVFTHEGFSLQSPAPMTKILGKKDNQIALVDSVGFAATDFSFYLTSPDLTEVSINYKLDGRNVSFRGCSILKPGF
ncbi:MAG: hypothetical protein K2K75_05670 [Muribaculaceae bacterium]|nr:hypothetical protein [Muribaculaceae bacterium]